MARLEILHNGMMWDNYMELLYRENDDGIWELHPEYVLVNTNGTDEFIDYEGNNETEARITQAIMGGEIRCNFTCTGWDVLV